MRKVRGGKVKQTWRDHTIVNPLQSGDRNPNNLSAILEVFLAYRKKYPLNQNVYHYYIAFYFQ